VWQQVQLDHEFGREPVQLSQLVQLGLAGAGG
jgi:hypothetical protein